MRSKVTTKIQKVGLIIFVLLISLSLNAKEVEAEKQPLDFSTVGIYGSYFDFLGFSNLKVGYFDGSYIFDLDAKTRASHLEELYQKGVPNLVVLYTFDRVSHKRPISEYIANTDHFLQGLNLDHIYAISLNEENVACTLGLKVMNSLYDHIKKNYDVKVYQWLSPPNEAPHPKLRADGWIINPYGARREVFRRLLMKHLVTGKPVIVCIWASPIRPDFKVEWEEMEPSSREQVEVCKEFNIPMFFFCVDAKLGCPRVWLGSDAPDIVPTREWFFEVLEKAQKTDTSKLPLPSANYSTGRKMKIAGDRDNLYRYEENFACTGFIDDATISGFLNLRWEGEKEVLFIEPRGDKKALVELKYHFFSDHESYNIESRLSGRIAGASEVNLSLSLDGHSWKHIARASGGKEAGPRDFNITSSAVGDNRFRGKEFWVRISGEVASQEASFVLLDNFQVTARVLPPTQRQILLKPDKEGKVFYKDDFQSQNYLHSAEIINEEHLIWGPGEIGISGRKGYANTVILRQRFISEKPLRNLIVTIEGLANAPNWASYNNLAVD